MPSVDDEPGPTALGAVSRAGEWWFAAHPTTGAVNAESQPAVGHLLIFAGTTPEPAQDWVQSFAECCRRGCDAGASGRPKQTNSKLFDAGFTCSVTGVGQRLVASIFIACDAQQVWRRLKRRLSMSTDLGGLTRVIGQVP